MAVLSQASPLQGAGKAAHDVLATTGLLVHGTKEANPSSPLLQDTPLAMIPTSAYQPCLWVTSNSEFVSSQWGLQGELPHSIDDAKGIGGMRMLEPRLGVEQLEGGGQGQGLQQRGVGGCPTYLTAARIARRWFPSCQSRELIVPPEMLGRMSSVQHWHWKGKWDCFPGAGEEAGKGFRLAAARFRLL